MSYPPHRQISYQPVASRSDDDGLRPDLDPNTPPLHNVIYKWSLWFGATLQPLQYVFCWWGRTRVIVRSRIRDLVTASNYTPTSAASIVNSCAVSLSTSEFSYLLQSPYIMGHTAMYWAIVNDRREAFSALVELTPQLSPACYNDFRLACMATSDHALFMQLGLESKIGFDGEPLGPSLKFWPRVDREVEICEGNGMAENQFVALVRFKSYQRYLQISGSMSAEFIARRRLWWLCIYYDDEKSQWFMKMGLSGLSNSARATVAFSITGRPKIRRRGPASRPSMLSFGTKDIIAHVPEELEMSCCIPYVSRRAVQILYYELGEWLMNPNSEYLDPDGTLCAKLEIRLK